MELRVEKIGNNEFYVLDDIFEGVGIKNYFIQKSGGGEYLRIYYRQRYYDRMDDVNREKIEQILSTFRFVEEESSVTPVPKESLLLRENLVGCSSKFIDIKFRYGTNTDPPEATLPLDLRGAVDCITYLVSGWREHHLFKFWFRIALKEGVDVDAFAEKLKKVDTVETVQIVTPPPPPP